jgi:hypothetical protein
LPWIKQSPDQVLDWVRHLPSPDLRSALLAHLAHSAYQLSAPERLSFVLALPDATAALAWIDQNAGAPGLAAASSRIQASILGEIAREEPATALAAWESLSSDEARAAAIGPITRGWGKNDPAAALRWSAKQNRARHTLSMDPILIYAWVQKDPEAALRWAESETLLLPAFRRMRPSLVSALGGYQENRAPRSTTGDLYSKINDSVLRAETLTAHLREWLSKDRPAAKAWLETHDALSPEQTAALLASPIP